MRIWTVDPRKMCKKHLNGEHAEIHMFIGTFRAKKKVDNYIFKNLLDIKKVPIRHYMLSCAMIENNSNHNSPFPHGDEYNRLIQYLEPDIIKYNMNYFRSFFELMRRCPECNSLIEPNYIQPRSKNKIIRDFELTEKEREKEIKLFFDYSKAFSDNYNEFYKKLENHYKIKLWRQIKLSNEEDNHARERYD